MNVSTQVPFEAPTTDRLALTLFIATALHALDITVVNRQNVKPPKEFDYLADSSQDGAGNTREKIQPQEKKVAQAPPPTPPAASKPTPTRVMTVEHSSRKTVNPDKTKRQKKSDTTRANELVNRSMEMLTLNQQINQELLAYSKVPKSKFISARTREFKYASYMRDWVAKVERVGELNYPDAARRENLSGRLIVQVALYPDGSVRDITIRKPSGHKILDDAAVRIVKLAAPFAPFPENIKRETDVLYITRTWVFTSGNRMKTR
jgi:protein TonB